jgi:hypothetical protein
MKMKILKMKKKKKTSKKKNGKLCSLTQHLGDCVTQWERQLSLAYCNARKMSD